MIVNILKQAPFSEEVVQHVEQHFPVNYVKKFDKPFQLDYSKNPLNSLEAEERFWEALAQLIDLQEFYVAKKIPLEHFYNSIYDLHFRVDRYYKQHGVYGLSERDIRWLTTLYRGEIFDLGSLRFQIAGFSYAEIERESYQSMPLDDKWKARFPEGTPIIMIHILDNTDFRPEKVDESFDLARDFFAKYFPEHDFEIFLCRTWLLYEPTRDLLSTDSNIASFSQRFNLIAENQNTKQALDRIYGTSDLEKIQQMEKTSSLAKSAYQNLDKLGVAAGIIYK